VQNVLGVFGGTRVGADCEEGREEWPSSPSSCTGLREWPPLLSPPGASQRWVLAGTTDGNPMVEVDRSGSASTLPDRPKACGTNTQAPQEQTHPTWFWQLGARFTHDGRGARGDVMDCNAPIHHTGHDRILPKTHHQQPYPHLPTDPRVAYLDSGSAVNSKSV
jgi:hypothetical protein